MTSSFRSFAILSSVAEHKCVICHVFEAKIPQYMVRCLACATQRAFDKGISSAYSASYELAERGKQKLEECLGRQNEKVVYIAIPDCNIFKEHRFA